MISALFQTSFLVWSHFSITFRSFPASGFTITRVSKLPTTITRASRQNKRVDNRPSCFSFTFLGGFELPALRLGAKRSLKKSKKGAAFPHHHTPNHSNNHSTPFKSVKVMTDMTVFMTPETFLIKKEMIPRLPVHPANRSPGGHFFNCLYNSIHHFYGQTSFMVCVCMVMHPLGYDLICSPKQIRNLPAAHRFGYDSGVHPA